MQSTNSVQFKNVFFSYGQNLVLEDISFEVKSGDFVGIIGPNGAGKTTVIKLILGILKPASGNIIMPELDFKVGYVPQQASQREITFPATVYEIVASGRAPLKNMLTDSAKEDSRAIYQALEACSIEDLKDRLLTELSGGQRQRVFIARALAIEPKLLLLDEPEAGVDARHEKEFYAFLEELNLKKGTTIIIISHNIDTITNTVKSVICINRGLTCHVDTKDFSHSDYVRTLYDENAHIIRHP